MSTGAYSIVRYANDVNDQRVNLGVVVWHPHDGYKIEVCKSLNRAQAVDKSVKIHSLKAGLRAMEDCLKASTETGRAKLRELSLIFTEGLQVTAPYPARISGLTSATEHLFQTLVPEDATFMRASSQSQYEKSLKSTLNKLSAKAHNVQCVDVGNSPINGVAVFVGLRTSSDKGAILWRALSLQSRDKKVDQIAVAKATALDVLTVRRELLQYRNDRQVVVLQPPKERFIEGLADAVSWLRHECDEVLVAKDREDMAARVSRELKSLA